MRSLTLLLAIRYTCCLLFSVGMSKECISLSRIHSCVNSKKVTFLSHSFFQPNLASRPKLDKAQTSPSVKWGVWKSIVMAVTSSPGWCPERDTCFSVIGSRLGLWVKGLFSTRWKLQLGNFSASPTSTLLGIFSFTPSFSSYVGARMFPSWK